MTIPADSGGNESLYPEIKLSTIQTDDGRDIAFSITTAAVPESQPILFFYPGGGNRRILLSLYKTLSDSKLICINRPGKGETSRPPKGEGHLDTAVHDAVRVLDHLGIDAVSLLCMCAGAPFCMAFALQQKERTTGNFMGISTWVQPADCGYENTSLTHYVGSHSPHLIAPIVGSVMSSIGCSLTSFPTGWVTSALRSKLSENEHEAFDEKYKDDAEFSHMMKWMQHEKGGQAADVEVLLSQGLIDYHKLGENLRNVQLWHGTKDSMVPYAGAEWLEEHVPRATLNTIQDGSHEGCMFLLHPAIVDALKSFGRGDDAQK